MTGKYSTIDYSVGRNYVSAKSEQREDAIYFSFSRSGEDTAYPTETFAGISPDEARAIAKALNDEADAFDEREAEREREKAKKTGREAIRELPLGTVFTTNLSPAPDYRFTRLDGDRVLSESPYSRPYIVEIESYFPQYTVVVLEEEK